MRELSTYPIAKGIRIKLKDAGYTSDISFKGKSAAEISADAEIPVDEAVGVLETIKRSTMSFDLSSFSADSLADKELSSIGIVTFSEAIDNLLGEGVPLSKVTEIIGSPGVGKTQMCMQLCADAAIPECLSGVSGQSVYIDTEGSFVASRCAQIAAAAVTHCQLVAKTSNDPNLNSTEVSNFNVEKVLKGIHYFRCTSCTDLLAVIYSLNQFITSDKCQNVKLILVDSLAFHFRHGWTDMAKRTRLLNSISQHLQRLATEHQLAIVLVNQVTTKIQSSGDAQLVPALGESWAHVATHRLLLYWENHSRFARLIKSSCREEATISFTVTSDGIRDVVKESRTRNDNMDADGARAKRMKVGSN